MVMTWCFCLWQQVQFAASVTKPVSEREANNVAPASTCSL